MALIFAHCSCMHLDLLALAVCSPHAIQRISRNMLFCCCCSHAAAPCLAYTFCPFLLRRTPINAKHQHCIVCLQLDVLDMGLLGLSSKHWTSEVTHQLRQFPSQGIFPVGCHLAKAHFHALHPVRKGLRTPWKCSLLYTEHSKPALT